MNKYDKKLTFSEYLTYEEGVTAGLNEREKYNPYETAMRVLFILGSVGGR